MYLGRFLFYEFTFFEGIIKGIDSAKVYSSESHIAVINCLKCFELCIITDT